jgi:hypothetical protein
MKLSTLKEMNPFSQVQVIRSAITDFLTETYEENHGLLGNLDRWTRSRIVAENTAKLELIMRSENSIEACYCDLVREIDCEAQSGIYLVGQDSKSERLNRLMNEAGISGTLHREVPNVAQREFPDEAAHSSRDFDLVWTTIHALHDRAHTDAAVSGIIMSHLLGNADSADDMIVALRALFYSYHEHNVRRRCELPPILEDAGICDIRLMISELAKRSGNYQQRISAIEQQVELFYNSTNRL